MCSDEHQSQDLPLFASSRQIEIPRRPELLPCTSRYGILSRDLKTTEVYIADTELALVFASGDIPQVGRSGFSYVDWYLILRLTVLEPRVSPRAPRG